MLYLRFLAAALLTLISLAQSQAIESNVEGIVRGPDGVGIGSAKVQLRNISTGISREAQADAQGSYILALLPIGSYEATVSHPGFQTLKRSGLTLSAGQTARLDFSMQVGEVSSLVEVTEETPAVETARTTAYSNVYTAREARNLPAAGRSLLDFFVMNPAVNAPPLSTGGSGTGTP
jgi:hypothetical protein